MWLAFDLNDPIQKTEIDFLADLKEETEQQGKVNQVIMTCDACWLFVCYSHLIRYDMTASVQIV